MSQATAIRRRAAVIIAGVVVGVGAGLLVAGVLGEDPAPPTERVVRVGDAALTVPGTWQAADQTVAGTRLDPKAAAVLSPGASDQDRVVVAMAAPADATLVPPVLRALLRDPPTAPEEVTLAGRPAWRYAALPTRTGAEFLEITLTPTSAGVLAVGCVVPQTMGGVERPDCGAGIRRAAIPGTAMAPRFDVALRLRLPAVLRTLDAARVEQRQALRDAATPAGQTAPAQALQRAYADAATALRPVAGAADRQLLTALTEASDAYGLLARRTTASGGAFNDARAMVLVREQRVLALLADYVSRDEPGASG